MLRLSDVRAVRDSSRVADLNLDGLIDICSVLGIEWRSVLVE